MALPPDVAAALNSLEQTVIAAKDHKALHEAIGTLVLLVGRLAALLALATARQIGTEPERSPLEESLELLASRQAARCLTMNKAAETYFPDDPKAENTLREAGRRGELPTVHVGRYVYVRQQSLERWIAAHESKR